MSSFHPLIYLVAVVVVIMMWRGLWGLMDEYLWPNNRKLSYWVTFIVGFVLIVLFLAIVRP